MSDGEQHGYFAGWAYVMAIGGSVALILVLGGVL